MSRRDRLRLELDDELIQEIRLIQSKVLSLTGKRISRRDALKIRMGAPTKTVMLFGKRKRMRFDVGDI